MLAPSELGLGNPDGALTSEILQSFLLVERDSERVSFPPRYLLIYLIGSEPKVDVTGRRPLRTRQLIGESEMHAIQNAIEMGGFWMWPIVAMSVLVLAVTLERAYMLIFRFYINADQFMQQIRKFVLAGNIDRAIKLCNQTPKAALPQIIKAGLMRANKGEVAIANALEEANLSVMPQVRKRTNSLLVFANVVTLIGLLGTIVGLIQSFGGLATADESSRQEVLSAGISVAMYTTAAALIVAIPALLIHLVLARITTTIIEEVDHYSVMLEDLLVTQVRGGASNE